MLSRLKHYLFGFGLILSLAACGGGDGGASPATVITQQPASISVQEGASAVFSVAATGPNLQYQWQVTQDQGTTWTDIPAAVSASYTVQIAILELSGSQYRVKIGGLISSVATLTVTSAPASIITSQPTAQTTMSGSTVSFSVTATGATLTFQWQLSIDGGVTWNDILNAIGASFTVAGPSVSMNGYQYRVVVSNGETTTTSAPATLVVALAPLGARLNGAAYYQPQLDATVVADANLPAKMPLGVSGIATDGTMTWSTAVVWVQALNASSYLGFADWRLPSVKPVNGSAFQFNSLSSDVSGYTGSIDLGYNISAPGSTYPGSTASELAYLFYNVLGSVAKYSVTGVAQDFESNTDEPLLDVAANDYWTSQTYGSDGAIAFDLSQGSQYAFVAESWHFHVIVLRSGDSGQ
jgi:hypothetical protein